MNCEEFRAESTENDSRNGSTLIEILVVISIMAIISAMLLSGSKDSAVRVALSTGQATVAGVLNRAKALTLAKYTETSEPSQLPCGFGVRFDKIKNALVIYQDSRAVPSVSCDAQSSHDYVAGDTIIDTVNLDPRIEFVGSPADVAFIAPYLKASREITITLGIKGGAQTTRVQVTVGGSISSL